MLQCDAGKIKDDNKSVKISAEVIFLRVNRGLDVEVLLEMFGPLW